MVDGDDDEEFPPILTRVALMVIIYLMLMIFVYLMMMFILYLMLLIFIVYLMPGAIKRSMHCLVNMCEQDISIDFCRVRGPHALMHSPSHTNIMPLSANDRQCTNNIRKSFELTFHFSKPVCPY